MWSEYHESLRVYVWTWVHQQCMRLTRKEQDFFSNWQFTSEPLNSTFLSGPRLKLTPPRSVCSIWALKTFALCLFSISIAPLVSKAYSSILWYSTRGYGQNFRPAVMWLRRLSTEKLSKVTCKGWNEIVPAFKEVRDLSLKSYRHLSDKWKQSLLLDFQETLTSEDIFDDLFDDQHCTVTNLSVQRVSAVCTPPLRAVEVACLLWLFRPLALW